MQSDGKLENDVCLGGGSGWPQKSWSCARQRAEGRGQRAEYVSAKSMLLLAGVRIAETPQPGVFANSTRSHNPVALGLANSKNILM
jgi:hypothetical protein